MTQSPSKLTIDRASTGKQVAEVLQGEILAARLPGGHRLQEIALAEQFGVSRGAVREAIQLLVAEGLVTHEPHRGAAVRRLTTEEVHDLYRVRRVIELAAVEHAAKDALEPLERAIDDLETAVAARDRVATVLAELGFHRGIVALLGSERMLQIFDGLGSETRLCMALMDYNYPDPNVLVEEHRAILNALSAGDGERARRLLAADLDKGDAVFSELTDSSGLETDG